MRNHLKLVVALLVPIFSFSLSAAGSTYTENPVPMESRQLQLRESLDPPLPWNTQYQEYSISANGSPIDNPSRIWGNNDQEGTILCDQLDAECLSSAKRFDVLAYFNYCDEVNEAPCLMSLEYKTPESEWLQAQFLRQVDYNASSSTLQRIAELAGPYNVVVREIYEAGNGVGFESNRNWGLPGSATGPLLFELPAAANEVGVDTYLFSGRLQYAFDSAKGTPKNLTFSNVDMSIRSYVEANDANVSPPVEARVKDATGHVGFGGFGTGGDGEVAWTEEGKRGWAVSYSPDLQFRLKVKLPNKIGGWFHGRLENSTMTVEPSNAGTNLVSITGNSVAVPVTSAWWEKFAPENSGLLKIINPPKAIEEQDRQNLAKGIGGLGGLGWSPGDSLDNSFYKAFSPLFPESAKGEAQTWYVGSLPKWETNKSPCLSNTDSLQGLITTNAMVYQPGLPEFKSGYLNYQVSGVHFDKDGEVAKGNYELIMRSDVARCLYGFSKAPVSGSVTVVDVKGKSDVSTTTLGEKNGWLKLTASNFSFSTKTIKAKLTQKKTTITCVLKINKKKTKKVTGYSPKCPSGYKKK